MKNGFAVWDTSSPTENPGGNNSPKSTNSSASPPKMSPSQKPQSVNDTVNNVKQGSSDFGKNLDPLKMAPSEVFEAGSSSFNTRNNSSDSSSFLKQERKQKAAGGFRPKTLESTQKKTKNNDPVQVVFVPETFSDDDSDDGFSLG